jgi:hypothetical protein
MKLNQGSSIGDAEVVKEAAVENDSLIDKVLASFRDDGGIGSVAVYHEDSKVKQLMRSLPFLSPSGINIVLQRMIAEFPRSKLTDGMTGLYLSVLVQKSYAKGNNDFTLNTQDIPIDNLLNYVRGTHKNNIRAAVFGNVGDGFGGSSNYLHCALNGNAGDYFGGFSKHLKCNIRGDADEDFGYCAYYLDCAITGDVGADFLSDAKSGRIILDGRLKKGFMDRVSAVYTEKDEIVLVTPNLKTYRRARGSIAYRKSVGGSLQGRSVVLVDSQGNELERYCDQEGRK